jgi:glycosyltransferase involved in cell wall biosynthesis
VNQELENTDLGILPYSSDEQSASGAIRDLLSHGIPVIASDIAAFMDIARSTNAIKIFRRNDLDSLKTKLFDALSNYSELSQAALEYCRQSSYQNLAQAILSQGNYPFMPFNNSCSTASTASYDVLSTV